MKDQIVPSLEFSGLTDEQLYYIFTVYNTNSTPLNAAEIRNAVYHATPLHRALMKEAGDLEDEGGNEIQPTRPEISNRFRAGVSPSKPPTRFAASEALMRACAFTLYGIIRVAHAGVEPGVAAAEHGPRDRRDPGIGSRRAWLRTDTHFQP